MATVSSARTGSVIDNRNLPLYLWLGLLGAIFAVGVFAMVQVFLNGLQFPDLGKEVVNLSKIRGIVPAFLDGPKLAADKVHFVGPLENANLGDLIEGKVLDDSLFATR